MNRLLVFAFLTLTIAACAPDEKELCGNWQAVAFYENGRSTLVSLDSVRLSLTPDHRYQFKTMGFYSESGSWKVSSSYLILKDTTIEPNNERMMKVLFQSADSLKIRMDKNGAEQALFFGKTK